MSTVAPVLLARVGDATREARRAALRAWIDRADAATAPLQSGDHAAARALALALGEDAPLPGTGRTRELWEILASIAAVDLSVARWVEPHLDALAIASQAGLSPVDAVWGVYAAEGPQGKLTATQSDDGWRLDGIKPWCSLADQVDRALVTAHVDGGRRLFDVDMSHATPSDEPWPSRGLRVIRSTSVTFHDAPATPVGQTGWYLERAGFWWGGMGVAAIWFGGTVALARRVRAAASRRDPDQVAQMHLGALDRRLAATAALLAQAAERIDAGLAEGTAGQRLELQVRREVSTLAEDVLARVGHNLGPGPLSTDEEHARRVADLSVYIRQDHAERDDAALGRTLLALDAADDVWGDPDA